MILVKSPDKSREQLLHDLRAAIASIERLATGDPLALRARARTLALLWAAFDELESPAGARLQRPSREADQDLRESA